MEITLVGMYADTSPACVSMIGRAVNDHPPNSSDNLAALGHITIFFTEEGECLPGSIRVKGKEFPKIEKESKIEILRK